ILRVFTLLTPFRIARYPVIDTFPFIRHAGTANQFILLIYAFTFLFRRHHTLYTLFTTRRETIIHTTAAAHQTDTANFKVPFVNFPAIPIIIIRVFTLLTRFPIGRDPVRGAPSAETGAAGFRCALPPAA
ncbi:MAG: hypothetical protein IIA40_08900, partial [SAR324 cluster bacterium]|nr:hypothetical protein [SAR324 cluster bacterium]